MPNNIIKHHGDPNKAFTLGGIEVQREEKIFLTSYNQWFNVIQTSMHFCFRDATVPRGTTLFCTCGSPAIIVGYEVYHKLNSTYIGNEAITCHSLIQNGRHADGSHE